MSYPLDQLSARGFNFGNRVIKIGSVLKPEPNMGDAAIHARHVRFGWILVERDEVRTTGCIEKDHLGAIAETLFHSEDIFVKAKRSIEITDYQMNVREALSSNHLSAP